MKAFAVVVVAVAVVAVQAALTPEEKEARQKKLAAYHQECSTVSGVDKDVLSKATKGEFADDPKLKEHLFCISKKAGFQNEKGEINFDVLKAKMTPELGEAEAEKLIKKCAIPKATPQETAFDTLKCYHESKNASLV